MRKLIRNPLISGSIILVFGSFFANFFSFIFSVVMGRMLAPADFGTLSSINAVITLPTIVANAITPLVIILAGTYFAQKQYDQIRGLYFKLSKLFFVIAIVVCVAFLFLIPQINSFFHINDNYLLILTDLIIFLSIMIAVNNSFIQAKLAFRFYVLILCSATIIKLIFAWIFVSAGFNVIGGVAGIFLGTLIPYLISFIPLKFVFNNKTMSFPKIDTKIFITYGIPAMLVSLGLSGFIINDLILVKHYFSPEATGLYAGLSLMGRIIFFISAPITGAMFPIIVQQHARKEKFTSTFLLALFLILLSSLTMTVFYTLFPKFSILFILKKQEYLGIIPYLTFFSIFITVYSLVSIIGNFYLSIKKTKIAIPVIISSLLQIILIIFFHQNILQIITISFGLNCFLLVGLLFYYPYATKKE
ncbi:oligosaccharide flippase family protein [Patescibacteria group bacterium]|nr:oligosaccharide flippase family protein [Patescibacteria group bacterium]MBU4015960.1 oligosaccharide flippase family protein [Patescibacteria group bacterium]